MLRTRRLLAQAARTPAAEQRGANRPPLNLEIGCRYGGFELMGVKPIPEFQLTLYDFSHVLSGARVVHIDTEDTNNAFCVGFATPAANDMGIAHILEHTTLCGSEKFPVRDPFFKMRDRSLSSFMNAMTYPDATMYPFATTNAQDFRNLLDVYLDAAFFPRLNRLDFLQEGHRLEFADPEDPSSPLQIKGVVFNEMKGVLADASSFFYMKMKKDLFGSESCYGHEFGGDPEAIPELTHQMLKSFHRRHYSPQNATVVTYGDLPPMHHFDLIDDCLVRASRRSEGDRVTHNPLPSGKWAEPRSVTITGPVDPMLDASSGSRVALAWVPATEEGETFIPFSLAILLDLLTTGPNAPIHKKLIESGIAASTTSGTGYASYLKGGCIEIGVQQVDTSTYPPEEIEGIVLETLREACAEGFSKERIESELHQLELATRHKPAKWGVNLGTGITLSVSHGFTPADTLLVTRNIDLLRQKLKASPGYFSHLIERYLLENPHRLTYTMHPDPEFPTKVAKKEEEKVAAISAGLSEEEKQGIVKQTKELLAEMDKVEDVSVLPTLHVEKDVPIQPIADPRIDLLPHDRLARFQNVVIPTNGVWYMKLTIPIHHLSLDEFQLLPLLSMVVGETGAGEYNFRELSQEFDLCSSGVGLKPCVTADPLDPSSPSAYLLLSSYGLDRCLGRFLELLGKVFNTPRLDPSDDEVRVRVQSLISMNATDKINSIVQSAHAYAIQQAAAGVDPIAWCSEQLDGFSQVQFMKKAMQATSQGSPGSDEALSAIIEKLRALHQKLLASLPGMKLSMTTSEPLDKGQSAQLDTFLASLEQRDAPGNPGALAVVKEAKPPVAGKSFVTIPSDVSFAAVVARTGLSYRNPTAPAAEVLMRILDTKFLHKEIREKGGAYGSGGTISACGNESLLGMFTYRDPSPATSYATLERCLEWITAPSRVGDRELNEAKITAFASVDAPKSPQNQGLREFISDITMDHVKERRARLRSIGRDDVLAAADELFRSGWSVPPEASQSWLTASRVTVGGESGWKGLESKGWTKLDMGMTDTPATNA